MTSLKIQAITEDDQAFPHETAEEVDLKAFINKHKANANAHDIIHTINLLHVKDANMAKRDLKRNIKLVNDNKAKLMESNGFDYIAKETGISVEKLKNPDRLSNQDIEKLERHEEGFEDVRQKRKEDNVQHLEVIQEFMEGIREKKGVVREYRKARLVKAKN